MAEPPTHPVAPRRPLPRPVRWLLVGIGWLFVGLAVVGAFVPFILPTVPFLIVAAACFAAGSPRLHGWLLAHPRLGPYIRDWERDHTIPRRAKVLAMVTLWPSILVTVVFFLDIVVPRIMLLGIAGLVSAYILSRPSTARAGNTAPPADPPAQG